MIRFECVDISDSKHWGWIVTKWINWVQYMNNNYKKGPAPALNMGYFEYYVLIGRNRADSLQIRSIEMILFIVQIFANVNNRFFISTH